MNLIEKYLGEAKDFDPIAIIMGKDKKVNKRVKDFRKVKQQIIKDLTKYFIKYKDELQRLDKKKYKENTKKVTIGGDKSDFQSFDMSIGYINDIRKQRKLKALLDALKIISSTETKLKSAIDGEDIADALAPLVDDIPFRDISTYAEKQYNKLKGKGK